MGEKFESWAIVELFGHQKVAGQVSEQQIAGQAMLRVDVPEMEGQAGWTRFYGGNAVYSVTPADEATTRAAAAMLQARPITVYGVAAPERQIGARLVDGDGYPQGFLDPEEDDDYLDEDGVDDEDDRS